MTQQRPQPTPYTLENFTYAEFEKLAQFPYGFSHELSPEEKEKRDSANAKLQTTIQSLAKENFKEILVILDQGLESKNTTVRSNAVLYSCFALDHIRSHFEKNKEDIALFLSFLEKALSSKDQNVIDEAVGLLLPRFASHHYFDFSIPVYRKILLGDSLLFANPNTQDLLARYVLCAGPYRPKEIFVPLFVECLQEGTVAVEDLMLKTVLPRMAEDNFNYLVSLDVVKAILDGEDSRHKLALVKNVLPVLVKHFPHETEPYVTLLAEKQQTSTGSLKGIWERLRYQEMAFAVKQVLDDIPDSKRRVEAERKHREENPDFFW